MVPRPSHWESGGEAGRRARHQLAVWNTKHGEIVPGYKPGNQAEPLLISSANLAERTERAARGENYDTITTHMRIDSYTRYTHKQQRIYVRICSHTHIHTQTHALTYTLA